MKKFATQTLASCGLVALLAAAGCTTNARRTPATRDDALLNQLAAQRVRLPNGWSLTPAGRTLPLGDFPMNAVVSPNKKYLAVTHGGVSAQTITLVDIATEKVLDAAPIAKAWVGLRFSADSRTLYASGGNDNLVAIYRVANDKLTRDGEIKFGDPWPKNKISVAGIEVDAKRNLLYAVTKEDSALYVCDLAQRKVLSKTKLRTEPYTCLLNPTGSELYVSLWGGEAVATFNPDTRALTGEIKTESHPNDLTTTRDGNYLFVANANDNSVSVVDTRARRNVENIATALYPNAPAGSTPNAVALSEDEQTLYIANADNNCLAVFDVRQPGRSRSRGFVPVGWYPTAVKVVGTKILVTNGKGGTSLANPKGPNPYSRRDQNTQYIGSLMKGSLSVIGQPSEAQLASYAKLTYDNTPYNKDVEATAAGQAGNPIPRRVGDPSPIKHVFYIIRENRTYDQVFGDVREGNGDSTLCLFPEKVTPNAHALVREFALFDNFYVDAEVSADGHNWSTAAYATDYVEKTWPTSYGGRGGSYDYEGSRKVAYPKAGFIWDYCQRAGVSYRSYGEFTPANDGDFVSPALPSVIGHYPTAYPNYNLDIKDVTREGIWEKDFDSLVAINALPRFNSVRLGNDHTSGTRVGKPTPVAHVADNDLALGRLVEHLSKSKVWGQSVVFVLEDDAQNGPDHVDAHRSPVLVISPYVKRKAVNHTMYTTCSVLRTIELIVGLPPMSQYDAAAVPFWDAFQATPDLTPFTTRPAGADLEARNVAVNDRTRQQERFDWSRPDRVPDAFLSEVVWQFVKGDRSTMPAPRRGAFVKTAAQDEDDD